MVNVNEAYLMKTSTGTEQLYLDITMDHVGTSLGVYEGTTKLYEASPRSIDGFGKQGNVYVLTTVINLQSTSHTVSEDISLTFKYTDDEDLTFETVVVATGEVDSNGSSIVYLPKDEGDKTTTVKYIGNKVYGESSKDVTVIVKPLVHFNMNYDSGVITIKPVDSNGTAIGDDLEVQTYLDGELYAGDNEDGIYTITKATSLEVNIGETALKQMDEVNHEFKVILTENNSLYRSTFQTLSFTVKHDLALEIITTNYTTGTYYYGSLVSVQAKLTDKNTGAVVSGQRVFVNNNSYITSTSGLFTASETCSKETVMKCDSTSSSYVEGYVRQWTFSVDENESYNSFTYTTSDGYKGVKGPTQLNPDDSELKGDNGDTFTFTGTVLDYNDKPLEGRTVSIIIDGSVIGTVTTDSLGRYSYSYTYSWNNYVSPVHEVSYSVDASDYTTTTTTTTTTLLARTRIYYVFNMTYTDSVLSSETECTFTWTANTTSGTQVQTWTDTPYTIQIAPTSDLTDITVISTGMLSEGTTSFSLTSTLPVDVEGKYQVTFILGETDYNIESNYVRTYKVYILDKITISNMTSNYGDSAIFKGNCNKNATEPIYIVVDDVGYARTTPNNGTWSYTLSKTTKDIGTYTIYAAYGSVNGTLEYNGMHKSANGTWTVRRTPVFKITSTTDNQYIKQSDSITITGTYTGVDTQGTLIFLTTNRYGNTKTLGTYTLDGSSGTFSKDLNFNDTTHFIKGGSYTVYMKFAPARNTLFNSTRVENIANVTLKKTADISFSYNKISDPTTLNITVTNNSAGTGTLVWNVNGTDYNTTGINNNSIDLSYYEGATVTILVTYSGCDTVESGSWTLTVQVRSIPYIVMSTSPKTVLTDTSTTISCTIKCNGSNVSVPCTAKIGSTTLWSSTKANSTYSKKGYTFSTAGNYTVNVSTIQTDKYTAITDRYTIKVSESSIPTKQYLKNAVIICPPITHKPEEYVAQAVSDNRTAIIVLVRNSNWSKDYQAWKDIMTAITTAGVHNKLKIFLAMETYNTGSGDEINNISTCSYSIKDSSRKSTLVNRLTGIAGYNTLDGVILIGTRPGWNYGWNNLTTNINTINQDLIATIKNKDNTKLVCAYYILYKDTVSKQEIWNGTSLNKLQEQFDEVIVNVISNSTLSVYKNRVASAKSVLGNDMNLLIHTTPKNSTVTLAEQKKQVVDGKILEGASYYNA